MWSCNICLAYPTAFQALKGEGELCTTVPFLGQKESLWHLPHADKCQPNTRHGQGEYQELNLSSRGCSTNQNCFLEFIRMFLIGWGTCEGDLLTPAVDSICPKQLIIRWSVCYPYMTTPTFIYQTARGVWCCQDFKITPEALTSHKSSWY